VCGRLRRATSRSTPVAGADSKPKRRPGSVGFVNLPPPTDPYPDVLAITIRAILSDGRSSGLAALEPIAGLVWAEQVASAPLLVHRPADIPGVQTGLRQFTPARAGATFRRDRFQCRYCGGRVIPVAVMSVLSHVYPEELPYDFRFKRGSVHPMYWTRGAEADHIEPISRGGDGHALENHATACVRCNTAKSDNRLEDIGWRLLKPTRTTWDGLTGSYHDLWERAGRPNARYHRPWLKALTGGS
jgi:5-methylcytosine-specific restriction endonuclease McrA